MSSSKTRKRLRAARKSRNAILDAHMERVGSVYTRWMQDLYASASVGLRERIRQIYLEAMGVPLPEKLEIEV